VSCRVYPCERGDGAVKLHIAGKITVLRAVVGLVIFTVGVYLVFPPTLFDLIALAIFSVALVTLYRKIEMIWGW